MNLLKRLPRGVPRTVVALGMVSLLTDLSSEMIYPLLPLFLTDVLGAGALALGVIEGIAESTSALFKIGSGWWTDRVERRRPFLFGGYGIAGAVRPLIAFAGSWIVVVVIRFADRVGKGVRTAPRDALIADVTPTSRRGAAFGLHRAMDHAGAVLGPLAAALLLWIGLSLRWVFFLAIVPAIAVIVVIARFVTEPQRRSPVAPGPRPIVGSVRELGPNFWRMLVAVTVFALGNSADAFLLLRLGDVGVTAIGITILWAVFHVIKVVANLVGGRMSDAVGRKRLILGGWAIYALVYLGMALVGTSGPSIALFLAYGIFFGMTEPVERAWVAGLAPANLRGSAFGYYNGAVGIAALPASVIFGGVWALSGPAAAFTVGAALAGLAAVLLLRVAEDRPAVAGPVAA